MIFYRVYYVNRYFIIAQGPTPENRHWQFATLWALSRLNFYINFQFFTKTMEIVVVLFLVPNSLQCGDCMTLKTKLCAPILHRFDFFCRIICFCNHPNKMEGTYHNFSDRKAIAEQVFGCLYNIRKKSKRFSV